MATAARHELADLLGKLQTGGSFATRRTAPVEDLAITVRGVGTLRLPVSVAQAKELRLVARPARYGKGEETLLDRRVRDTWEVPRSRVSIDKRRWNETLGPMLAAIGQDLGLPAGASLRAELHSMLVYEPGQFFAPHQDSEKDDRMVASLVVLLPSRSTGGELVIEHRGESVTYQGSTSALTFVAFYADTRHEVRPVTRGYRVALTYNLMLTSANSAAAPVAGTALVDAAAELLEQHFRQLPARRWRGDSSALEPPDRLVFLLDHQYSERSLRWAQLKGDDATRADVLRAAAAQALCDVALVYAEVHETWSCYEPAPRWGGRRWEPEHDDAVPKGMELDDLMDSSVEISSAAGTRIGFDPFVPDAELATATPSLELTPYETEYTGDMGNYGNTMEHWYHRAAIVIWPRARAFAVRAAGDPASALHELLEPTDDRAAGDQRIEDVSTLLRFWPAGVREHDQRTLLPLALRLAVELDDEDLSTALLEPFDLEALTADDAADLVALAELHGADWFDRRVATWMREWPRSRSMYAGDERAAWMASLPELCAGILGVARSNGNAAVGRSCALSVLHEAREWLHTAITAAAAGPGPSMRRAALADLSGALVAVLRSATLVGDDGARAAILETACNPNVDLTPLLLGAIEASTPLSRREAQTIGLVDIARHGATVLQEQLARPERAEDDWSIDGFDLTGCCDDCTTLAAFLANPAQQQLVWPLAKPRRQHIHRRIDVAELPVTHQTRRQGIPHQLVLTKTAEVFARDAERRAHAEAALRSIQPLLRGAGRSGTNS